MSKANLLIVVGLVAAVECLATATASATTPGWIVNGTPLVGSTTLPNTAKVDEKFDFSAEGKFYILCSGQNVKIINGKLDASNKISASSLIFTECELTNEGECTLASPNLGTVPLLAEATLEGALAVRTVFKVYATYTFQGADCALTGTREEIGGRIVTSSPTGRDERTTQLLSVNTEASELGGWLLKGSFLLKLSNSDPWSFS